MAFDPYSSASPPAAPTSGTVFFDRKELSAILSVYGRMVAGGHWKDYGIDSSREAASFCVFRRASEAPLYRIEAAGALPATVSQALIDGRLDAAMFFSPRSATVFRDLLLTLDARLAGPLTALCISAETAAALSPLAFALVRVAARPNQGAMLALVE